MNILIGIPTGNRHKQAVEVIKAWRDKGIDTAVITWDSPTDLASVLRIGVICTPERQSFAYNHNRLAKATYACCSWDAYIAGADDLWPGDFDLNLLMEYIKAYPDKILYVHDGCLSRCATHPVITRAWFESHNKTIYDEAYGHGWCDVDLTVTSAKENSIVKCFDIRFDHRHPMRNKAVEVDEIYKLGRKLTAEGTAYFQQKFAGVDVETIIQNIEKGKL